MYPYTYIVHCICNWKVLSKKCFLCGNFLLKNILLRYFKVKFLNFWAVVGYKIEAEIV